MKKEEFKLPKKIILLGEIYTIKQEYLKDLVAEIRYWDKVIIFNLKRIAKLKIRLEEVFWHELGHYFFRYYGLDSNEQIIEAFAQFVVKMNNQLKDVKKS